MATLQTDTEHSMDDLAAAAETVIRPRMFCRRCFYPLGGLGNNQCPECGKFFDPAKPNTWLTDPGETRLRRRLRLAFHAICGIAAILFIVLAFTVMLDYLIALMPLFMVWIVFTFAMSPTVRVRHVNGHREIVEMHVPRRRY